MEEYNKNKEYPLGTIVNTKYGKTIVEKSDGNCGNDTCVFAKSRRYCGQCYKSRRKDNQYIYFKLLKEENMEKRNIQIDINTARKWYKGDDKSLRILAKQAFTIEELETPELSKSWEEYLDDRRYTVEKDYIRNLITLKHLLTLRDVYRQGWKPNWNDSTTKFTIESHFNEIVTDRATNYSCGVFSFPTRTLAEKFLENFKDELEQLKELL